MNRWCLSLLLLTVSPAWAEMTIEEVFEDGKSFGQSDSGAAAVKAAISDTTAVDSVPNYGTAHTHSSYYGGGDGDPRTPGGARVSECASVTYADAKQQAECDAINDLANNRSTRPPLIIVPADPILVQGATVKADPAAVAGAFGGAYGECTTTTVTQPATYEEEICNEFKTLGTQYCSRVLIVTCDPQQDGCDQGGIVPNSWQGDMVTSFTPDGAGNYILQFGTIANNYWSGWGAIFDRTLTFDIQDLQLITLFELTRAAFDDWLLVKVNGTTVYVGPYGGDRLEIYSPPPVFEPSSTRLCQQTWTDDFGASWQCQDKTAWWSDSASNVIYYAMCSAITDGWSCTPNDIKTGWVQYCATCFGSPELSTSWDKNLSIDIKQHLLNGTNTVFMRTIVAGKGEGAIQIKTRQLCPLNCHDQWDDSQCALLDARTQ